MTIDLALQALLLAVWRRKPTGRVTVHSDQGSQFTSREWQTFLRHHDLERSMSRRGNRNDNPKRKHTNNGMLSPIDFEIRQRKLKEAGV